MTLWFVGMTSEEAFLQALTPPSCHGMGPSPVKCSGYLQLYPLQAAVMAVGPLVLFPCLIVESWQGVSIEPLKRTPGPNWGSIKQCPWWAAGPRSDPLLGKAAPLASLSLVPAAAASMHLLRQSPSHKNKGVCSFEFKSNFSLNFFPKKGTE